MAELLQYHPDIPIQDDRVRITVEEARSIEGKHIDRGAEFKIKTFPRKEKAKLVVLRAVAGLFEKNRVYSDRDITGLLKPVYQDVATIRRYLIDYKFLFRDGAGREYRLNSKLP